MVPRWETCAVVMSNDVYKDCRIALRFVLIIIIVIGEVLVAHGWIIWIETYWKQSSDFIAGRCRSVADYASLCAGDQSQYVCRILLGTFMIRI